MQMLSRMNILALITLSALVSTASAADCGGTFNAYTTSEITSPNYPSNYDAIPDGDPELECEYFIVAPGRYRIDVELVDLELGYRGSFDISNRDAERGPDYGYYNFIRARYGRDIYGSTGPFRSSGQTVRIRFEVDDGSTAAKGFRVKIKLAPPAGDCGGALDARRAGEITSRNFPDANYNGYEECVWEITAPQGRNIVLTFHDVHLNFAEIYLYSGLSGDWATTFIERIGGNWIEDYQHPVPYTVRCPTNQMSVYFGSDDEPAWGFRATYKLGCGGSFSAETTDEILTPNYPGDYDAVPVGDDPFECDFLITAPAGYRPVLTFPDVELGTARVQIKDQGGQILDDNPALPYAYTSQVIEVVFTVYPDNTAARGFRGKLQMVADDAAVCGGELSASSPGQITSPHYPAVYPNDAECSWVITAPEGNFVTLTFLDIYTGDGSDYVEVYDGPTTASDSLGSFSGNYPESPLTSTGAEMLVYFTSDDMYAHPGFRVTYVGRDIDECAIGTHECNIYAVCTNTNGGYTCQCKSGYTGDGSICTDVDECTESSTICGQYDTCRNINGGYVCLDKAVVQENLLEQVDGAVPTLFRTDTPPSEYLIAAMLTARELNNPNLDLSTVCKTGSTGIYTVLPSALTYEELQADFDARRSQYFRAGRYSSSNEEFYSGIWGSKCFAARSRDAGYMDTFSPEFEVILAYWARKGMRRLYSNYYVVFSSRPASELGAQLINDVFKLRKNKQRADLSTRTIFMTDYGGGSLKVHDFARDAIIPYPPGLDLQEVISGPLQVDTCVIDCAPGQGIAAVDRNGECRCNCIEGYTGELCGVTDDICREAVEDTLCENDGTAAIGGVGCVCLCIDDWTGTVCTVISTSPSG